MGAENSMYLQMELPNALPIRKFLSLHDAAACFIGCYLSSAYLMGRTSVGYAICRGNPFVHSIFYTYDSSNAGHIRFANRGSRSRSNQQDCGDEQLTLTKT